jgi:hypothetical protein
MTAATDAGHGLFIRIYEAALLLVLDILRAFAVGDNQEPIAERWYVR